MEELKKYEEPEMEIKFISFADIIVTSVVNKTEDPVYIEDVDPGNQDNPFG